MSFSRSVRSCDCSVQNPRRKHPCACVSVSIGAQVCFRIKQVSESQSLATLPSGSHPLVTPYYCRLGDLLCIVFIVWLLYFFCCVFCVFLQYFDTVCWVFWPVKTVACITCTVLVETLNHAQSISRLNRLNSKQVKQNWNKFQLFDFPKSGL